MIPTVYVRINELRCGVWCHMLDAVGATFSMEMTFTPIPKSVSSKWRTIFHREVGLWLRPNDLRVIVEMWGWTTYEKIRIERGDFVNGA